jgi:hypothetical protein
MAAGEQSPLPPSAASSAIDHTPGRVIFIILIIIVINMLMPAPMVVLHI